MAAGTALPLIHGPRADRLRRLATYASVTVASEPSDDEPGWTEVPDRHLLVATADEVSIRSVADSARVRSIDSDVSTEGIVS